MIEILDQIIREHPEAIRRDAPLPWTVEGAKGEDEAVIWVLCNAVQFLPDGYGPKRLFMMMLEYGCRMAGRKPSRPPFPEKLI